MTTRSLAEIAETGPQASCTIYTCKDVVFWQIIASTEIFSSQKKECSVF